MFASALETSVAYLLATVFVTIPPLFIVAFIACPAVWSRDPTRRARARYTLLLLGKSEFGVVRRDSANLS